MVTLTLEQLREQAATVCPECGYELAREGEDGIECEYCSRYVHHNRPASLPSGAAVRRVEREHVWAERDGELEHTVIEHAIDPLPSGAADELVERLRKRRLTGKFSDLVVKDELCLEAADAITALEARVAELTAERDKWHEQCGQRAEWMAKAERQLAEARKIAEEAVGLLDSHDKATGDFVAQLAALAAGGKGG